MLSDWVKHMNHINVKTYTFDLLQKVNECHHANH